MSSISGAAPELEGRSTSMKPSFRSFAGTSESNGNDELISSNEGTTAQSSLNTGPESQPGEGPGQGKIQETIGLPNKMPKQVEANARQQRGLNQTSNIHDSNSLEQGHVHHQKRPSSEEDFNSKVEKAPEQIKQVVGYNMLLEARVQALESRISTLKIDGNPTVGLGSKDTSFAPYILKPLNILPEDGLDLKAEIKRVSSKDFHKNIPDSVIDVLYGDVEDSSTIRMDSSTKQLQVPWSEELQANSGNQTNPSTKVDVEGQRPSRVRINSRRLRVAIRELTGQRVMWDSRQILAPFKLFTQYEQEVRQYEKILEAMCCKVEKAASTEPKIHGQEVNTEDHKSHDLGNIPQFSYDVSIEENRSRDRQSKTPEELLKPETLPAEKGSESNTSPDFDNEDGETIEDNEDFDESTLTDDNIFAVMEICQVSRREACTAMLQNAEPSGDMRKAVGALRSKMSAEKLEAAAAKMSEILLPEWRALLKLLDEDLKMTFDICAQIRSGELQKIAFENLHHLFEPGDFVFAPEEETGKQLEAYRVVAVSGGRKLLNQSAPSPNDDPDRTTQEEISLHAPTRYSPFIVECLFYDFNGFEFGGVTVDITIPKYEDVQLITSLAVFPAKFRSDGLDWRAILIARGERFVRLCSLTQVSHKQYVGRTLDDRPEEVDSRVIVDFHLAATVNRSHRPDDSDWMPKLSIDPPPEPDRNEVDEILPEDKQRKPCARYGCDLCYGMDRSPIFNDQSINKQQSKVFFEKYHLLAKETIVDRDLGPDELLLLPNRVFGFVLRSRKWGKTLCLTRFLYGC